MADYIDREELKKVIREDEYSSNALNMLDDILSMPSVDAVEVVRCRDCRWWNKDSGECEILEMLVDYGGHYETKHKDTAPDDYCKWGEKNEC